VGEALEGRVFMFRAAFLGKAVDLYLSFGSVALDTAGQQRRRFDLRPSTATSLRIFPGISNVRPW